MTADGVVYAANLWEDAVERVEQSAALDPIADSLHGCMSRLLRNGRVKDVLSGTWLGHAAHPMFTDLPIGFWTSAFVLDLVGGRQSRGAAELLVGFGVLSALPTAATGASDWSDTEGASRRVGLVHAMANASATVLYAWSWNARRRDRYVQGVALGMLGATAATVGGLLGGHLLARLGTGVDHTAFLRAPTEWTPTLAEAGVSDVPVRVEVGGVPVLLVRHHGRVVALSAICPHRGAPLDEGTVEAETITCPWHRSRFALDGGRLMRGPAAEPLACYESRVVDGTVEVRSRRS